MSNTLESFDVFANQFKKSFSHQPCIVIDVTHSNLAPSPWSGDGNRNNQLCCQLHFDPTSNGGRYEIAVYDNGYAYYEALEGERLRSRLERYNPQMEFRDLKKVLEKMRQIFEESSGNKKDNQISVQLMNDDILVVDIKGRINSSILFSYMFRCQRREGEFYEANYVRQIVYGLAARKSRELELMKIIQAKDKELDDYRSQGTCQLQRAWLATQPFDKDEFDKATSRQVQQRHDDVLMHTLDLAFDRQGQQLIEECLLRNEYHLQVRSSHNPSSSSAFSSNKNQSSLKRTQSSNGRNLTDEEIAAEKRRHQELEERLRIEKEKDEQLMKKKKRKFV